MSAFFANKWVQRVLGTTAIIGIICMGVPILRHAIFAAAKSMLTDASGMQHSTYDVGPTRVFIDASRLEAVGVPVTISKPKRIDNSSKGKAYSGLVNLAWSSKGDLPMRALVKLHLTLKQVKSKEGIKIPSRHLLRLSLPQPVATKDDVSYYPKDLKNVKLGLGNRIVAGLFNKQMSTEEVYEQETQKLATLAMSTSGLMTKARKLIQDVANGWISGLPGYEGYKVEIHWRGQDLSKKYKKI